MNGEPETPIFLHEVNFANRKSATRGPVRRLFGGCANVIIMAQKGRSAKMVPTFVGIVPFLIKEGDFNIR